MKRIATFLALAPALLTAASAQTPDYGNEIGNCTSIMVGRKASTDGSVMTTHACDSWYRTWVKMVPAADYERDTVMDIYTGRMHTEKPGDMTGVAVKGRIPQARHTYKYLDTAYPCLNEKKLGIGETTITGRSELRNPDGLFMIEELERVALQRCTTAREAILLMGELVKEYGYGDSGECLTIADPREVWHFEIFGEGPDSIGAVWAAVRIPDDHVGVSANIPRISTIDPTDTKNCLASDNVYEVARRMGFWDGTEPFKFWKAYAGGNYYDEPKSFHMREHYILNKLAPSLHLDYNAEELPISVKPDEKVDVTRVMALMREYYEGDDLDITKNLKIAVKNKETGEMDTVISPVANPWMRRDEMNLYNALKDSTVNLRIRNVSVPQCAYSTVIQLRDDLPDGVGGVVWFALDNPGQSPRFPVFCGTESLPDLFNICGNHRYRHDCALWHYREANKLASLKWGVYRKPLEAAVKHFEEKGLTEMPFIRARYAKLLKEEGEEAANKMLTDYTADFIGATILRWDELTSRMWNENRYGF